MVLSAGLILSTEHSEPLSKQVPIKVSSFASVNASVLLEPASNVVDICWESDAIFLAAVADPATAA
jgi:hypothetical protein